MRQAASTDGPCRRGWTAARRQAPRAVVLAVAVWLAGCASPPPPHGALASAAASIEAARAAGAPEWAPVPWQAARRLLDQARALAGEQRVSDAERLADQADAVARVAQARSAAEREAMARESAPAPAPTSGASGLASPSADRPDVALPDPPAAAVRGPAFAPQARPRRPRR